MEKERNFHNYLRLWNFLSHRRKIQFYLLLILIVLTSLSEVISLGALLPFLGVLIAPEKIFEISFLKDIWVLFDLTSPNQLLLPITVLFAVGALVAGGMRLLLLYVSTRLTFAMSADISLEIYRRTLYQPYSVHIARNSADVISSIMGKSNGVVYYTISPLMTLATSLIILTVIMATLIMFNPMISLVVFCIFGSFYLFVALRSKTRLQRNGKVANDNIALLQRALQEGLGGIRDVLIDGSQRFYVNIYQRADIPYRKSLGDNIYISTSPRYTMESLGMAIMAVFAYRLSETTGSLISIIPLLGALAMGAQRMLPVLQQAYTAWSNLKIGTSTLGDVLDLLDQPLPRFATEPDPPAMPFQKEIRLESVSYHYNSNSKIVLDHLSITIPKGGRVGIVGKTGSGKSTLLDLIMGLIDPTEGKLFIDGIELNADNLRSWQRNIAHVPQFIYLSDNSIAENIALGVTKENIDLARVRRAAEKAQIANYIESLPLKYDEQVGERGVRLSGGQRQRIGIARALYKEASVIVFDEATSALDVETEKAVMGAIEGLGRELTILMIAHRLSTVEKCEQIIELESGKIKR
ncbi:ABC transporter ATP-binding protein [Leptospira sp. 201903075]|uniref:ABC transporter ATP-binding protein n=1 Tax=Leptospira chreensis TaxID=2810035 RepID=UPI00196412CB|nr:ABC transporter ATP-binding protein [Leptospira chreensis]MBM9589081.1 ABC transporter ATP-binding protein [Leptospira chreensis]